MSIGILHTNIVLHEPGKLHRGSLDPIRGHINVRYSPGPRNNGELFGPLRIVAILHGRAKTKVWKSSGQSTHIYRGRATLFRLPVIVFNGAFRAQPGESVNFPFQLNFPELTGGPGAQIDQFEGDVRFAYPQAHPLPPSFNKEYSGFSRKYDCFVEYRVGVNISMPGLPVGVVKPDKYSEPFVGYRQPGQRGVLPERIRESDLRGYVSVSSALLLPESKRPSGFKQKAKVFFGAGNLPTYAFDWLCVAPLDLYFGQPIAFRVSVKPREKECTAPLIPDIRLRSFLIDIKESITVRTERSVFTCIESGGTATVAEMAVKLEDSAPLSEENNFTKIVTTAPFINHRLAPTFRTYNIAVAYFVRVRFAFEVADKLKKFDREFRVVIRPPLESQLAPSTEPGPSSAPAVTGEIPGVYAPPQEPLPPPYEETPTGQQ
ncbi:hypothetical protein GGS20DRAFT_437473 [Poronia punctata]|nr:hypothetical protein GGS20DRAFT_437473 [Poronia punctata]